jgi:hypothetical protein
LLDKGLEFVQSMCEQAAHQFLRDGDCDEEIAKIKTRLADTNVLADKELERRLKEGPTVEDLALQLDPSKGRSYRVQTMRREPAMPGATKRKDGPLPPNPPNPSPNLRDVSVPMIPASAPTPPRSMSPSPERPAEEVKSPAAPSGDTKLEADDSIGDEYDEMPKLFYKSTRRMMGGGGGGLY